MHRFKKVILVLVAVVVLACIWFHELLGYGIGQGYGQLKIIINTQPVEEVMQDHAFPDSLKSKLKLVQEIRKFAFDSLGINYSDNYTTVYDQKGKPLLWVVTGAEPFQLKAKEWTFPFLGTVSYKGFFDHEKAKIEELDLYKQGYDTSIGEVSGWSTLGWFKDPILSEMLKRSPGSLANLIIHELTHGTLYVKDNVNFNENLASFVGDKGALKFLEHKYGKNSKEYIQYTRSRILSKEYTNLVLKYADTLSSLYSGFTMEMSIEEKKKKKAQLLEHINNDLTNFLNLHKFSSKKTRIMKSINNTFFLDFKRYGENLDNFEQEYRTKFNCDIKKYMDYLKNKYPSL
jgi:predicted aminopeptidase